MTDQKTFKHFKAAGGLLAILLFFSFFMKGYTRVVFIEENGVIEIATDLAYLWCVVYILTKGGISYLKQYYYLLLLIIFCLLRELDFHKRFTTMGIFKTDFFMSGNTPLIEKIAGGIVIMALLYWLFLMIYHHARPFIYGLKKRSAASAGVLIVFCLLIAAKSVDGLSRKLNIIGIEMKEIMFKQVTAMEEIMELGIPVVLILTCSAYFKTAWGSDYGGDHENA